MYNNRFNPPDFDLSLENIPDYNKNKVIIFEKGLIPKVDFSNGEVFRRTEIYNYTKLSKTAYFYRAPLHELKKIYLEKYGNLDQLIGKDFHTKEAKKTFFEVSKSIIPTEEEYFKYLIKVGSKFYHIGNDDEQFFKYLSFNITLENPFVHHSFNNSKLYEIVELAQSKSYQEQKKCIVFNENIEQNIHPIAKFYFHRIAVGKHYSEKIEELFKLGLTQPQIAELVNCSRPTVNRHLKKLALSTKGHKKAQTIKVIKECHEAHKTWSKKKVAEYLKISYRNVKGLWSEI